MRVPLAGGGTAPACLTAPHTELIPQPRLLRKPKQLGIIELLEQTCGITFASQKSDDTEEDDTVIGSSPSTPPTAADDWLKLLRKLHEEGKAIFQREYTISRHTADGRIVTRDLAKGKEAHIFNPGTDLAALEQKVWTNGVYNGEVRDWHRIIYRSDTPIGVRIQKGRPDVLLYEVELKIRPRIDGSWEYHLVPRTRPAQ